MNAERSNTNVDQQCPYLIEVSSHASFAFTTRFGLELQRFCKLNYCIHDRNQLNFEREIK